MGDPKMTKLAAQTAARAAAIHGGHAYRQHVSRLGGTPNPGATQTLAAVATAMGDVDPTDADGLRAALEALISAAGIDPGDTGPDSAPPDSGDDDAPPDSNPNPVPEQFAARTSNVQYGKPQPLHMPRRR